MQINGIGNNQIGNSYQNPNRMPNSTTGKKENDDVSKRLEALGVKVELSFQQAEAQSQEQEVVKDPVEADNGQQAFSVLGWIKKIWDAGIAWLKSVWNDEAGQEDSQTEEMPVEAELVAEVPFDEEAEYAAMHVKEQEEQHVSSMETPMSVRTEPLDYRVGDDDQVEFAADKFRTEGTALRTSGMQDSYNRYGQYSKLGVGPSNNVQLRK